MNEQPIEIARARQLFEFLKAFAEQRLPKQRLTSQHRWTMALSDLPDHPSISVGEVILSDLPKSDDVAEEIDEPLLRVRRPTITPPPAPPSVLVDFVAAGWELPDGEVPVRRTINVIQGADTIAEAFEAAPARVVAFTEWKLAWETWATAERPARRAMGVFERLYHLRGLIERESEQVELMLGDGRLRWNRTDGAIDHPILLQRVELVFDTDRNEFVVIDADRDPEIYLSVLSGCEDISPGQFRILREELVKGGYHPLAGAGTSGYLRRLTALLGPLGEFVEQRPHVPVSSEPIVGRDPILILRGRQPGFAAAFERVLEDLATKVSLPSSLTRVLGIEHGNQGAFVDELTPPWGEPPDVLLSKPANAEQVQVARALERTSAVLVQGPPGTGKSHTIANLIGHLVAQGKRVLVTSHTTKALKVLRGLVVETLQPLCVSVLENDSEGRAQLESSVRSILTRLTGSSEDSLRRDVREFTEARAAMNETIATIVGDLKLVRHAEYAPILVAGEPVDPADGAIWVANNAIHNDWIPGAIEPSAPLPLSLKELDELYATSAQVLNAEETELALGLADLASLPDPEDFTATVAEAEATEPSLFAALWKEPPSERDIEALAALEIIVQLAVADLERFSPWQRAIISEGHAGGSAIQLWTDLARMVDEARARWEGARSILLEHEVTLIKVESIDDARSVAEEIRSHIESGGSLGPIALLTRGRWKQLIRDSGVNGRSPSTRADFRALCTHLALLEGRSRLAVRWSRQAEPIHLPDFLSLPTPIELSITEYSRQFAGLLSWWGERWHPIERAALDLGFHWDHLRAASVAEGPPLPPFERDAKMLRESFQAVISARVAAARARRAVRRLRETTQSLEPFHGPVCRALHSAVAVRDSTSFESNHRALRNLHDKVPTWARRRGLAKKLELAAPNWASAILTRSGTHGSTRLPGDATAAWRWLQLRQEIDRRAVLDEVMLGNRLKQAQIRLREATSELIDRKAWLAQKQRVQLKEQQALNGWAQLQRKIGKGTGKRAPALQAEARRALSNAQGAVPVWIMPLARVAEAIDPVASQFDVVIIDEASQCDINGLLAWYLADQIVVVGDDKQVSPMAVGQKHEDVQGLINQHLVGIPNYQIYDGTTSIYDLAQQSFGGTIRLREHFRCMPDIIEFSNELSYDFEIQPLRNPRAAPPPHVVECAVAGAVRDGKTNLLEARTIAAMIGSLIEQPECVRKTIGAISLVGEDQADLIWKETALVTSPDELQRRQFVAGNSAQFQGDDRNVIFLSMVDVGKDGPLSLRQEPHFKQRYNVAASRARDQLWVVHSLDPSRDLKPGDLRRHLIDYVRNPGARGLAAERAKKRAESPFEIEVIERLSAAGYAVESQVKVGSYRIDMVVTGSGGKVALECDGARYHPLEKIPEDLARQAILERAGNWRFIRIRSTAFYTDRDRTMARIFGQLRDVGIEADGLPTLAIPLAVDPFIDRVRRRAWEIMREKGWLAQAATGSIEESAPIVQ